MKEIATEQLWIDFGLDTAVFLDFIAHWLHLNSSNRQPRNFHEGRYWTYNTLDALHSIFPGWPKETIRNIIRKSVKNGLLIVSNFNKKKYDRTNWYTLSDLALKYYPKLAHLIQQPADNPGGVSCGDFTAGSGKFTAPIPNTSTTGSINTNTTSESNDSAPAAPKSKKQEVNDLMRELIDIYRQEFPDNPQPHAKLISTSLDKVLRGLIKRWPEADPYNKPLTPDAFRQYMKALKSIAPKFALGAYETKSGRLKKNGLETFCRWDNFVKFLEEQYS